MQVQILQDREFGALQLRRSAKSKYARLSIDARGAIKITLPSRAPLFWAIDLIESSRPQIRQNLAKHAQKTVVLKHGDLIGKTHRLRIQEGETYESRITGMELRVTVPRGHDPHGPDVQQFIRTAALKALRTQAKAYLTRRLTALASEHDFTYQTVRFSNAGTRWGSCSSAGTISLNIWLMQLPFELIDYVIIHELCHTRHMNHSPHFWQAVQDILPNYKLMRKQLKTQSPYV